MEKYQNKSKLMKFVHRNTGYIICGIILSIAIPLYLMETESQEFFESWHCSRIQQYLLLDHTGGNPTHDELTEKQHERLHEIISECDFPEVLRHD